MLTELARSRVAVAAGCRAPSSPSSLHLPPHLPRLLPFNIDQAMRRYRSLKECCLLERQGGRKVDKSTVHEDVGGKDNPTQEDAVIVVSVFTLPSSSLVGIDV